MFRRKAKLGALSTLIDDLAKALSLAGMKTSRNGGSLTVRHPKMVTHVEVVLPDTRETADALFEGVVQIKTEVPPDLTAYFSDGRLVAEANALPTLGALTHDKERWFIGSRLTVFREENSWDREISLVLLSTMGAAKSILGALGRTVRNEKPEEAASAWTDEDFDLVHSLLSRFCVYKTGVGLAAEFALEGGRVDAAFARPGTALWQLRADTSHPDIGGGLLCTLRLPHSLHNVGQIANQLNRMEMASNNLVPHFGAWCGNKNAGLAYVTFLPNELHSVHGIAVIASLWALQRAEWANVVLSSVGGVAMPRHHE
jgi:hypothetical protein